MFAAELIAEKGFDRFSLRELSDRLGVKTASLYNHISSLSELTSNIGQLA
ncbi:MAG: helix-turn-helix transcriptional regulator, partial [Lachnospiraceae bacterium]|nr:helix-turn-helix transcriptional regulator [Lachnospiraceae bacterium]